MSKELFGLVDCNNFYVSCERVFEPKLEGKPCLVLSNNDGCVIARSNEVKKLGVPMGMPFFQCEELIKKHGIKWFSSNYVLYGDMSQRVMETLAKHAPEVETYSIDEAFIKLCTGDELAQARAIRQTIKQWVGIPVSIGLAPTKTLAKVANHIAKKQEQHAGVFDMSKADVDQQLATFPVGELWGIGRQYEKKLHAAGIETALQLKQAPNAWIQKHFTIQGLRLAYELRGISCLPLEYVEEPRKNIACTRSFGCVVHNLSHLQEAVAAYIARGAEKLRKQHLAASYLRVFIHTSRHRENPFYATRGVMLEHPTSFTPTLNTLAQSLLERIYEPGYDYVKAGILLEDLVPSGSVQQTLFEIVDTEKQARLMLAVDAINGRHGRHTVRSTRMGFEQSWKMKSGNMSRRYTTRFDELATVYAK